MIKSRIPNKNTNQKNKYKKRVKVFIFIYLGTINKENIQGNITEQIRPPSVPVIKPPIKNFPFIIEKIMVMNAHIKNITKYLKGVFL